MVKDAAPHDDTGVNYYLLKAEPDTRMVKGKDVKFSVDDFEEVKTSPWEGVRNFEARNIMKEMKVGDKALFYHSNCKNPGIAAFAEVSKEAYPDFTAWDSSHPYFDPKTDKENPKWFMVDLTFVSRPTHFVPLSLLRYLTTIQRGNLPAELKYLGDVGLAAIQGMDLVTRGRLSVQRVRQQEWEAIHKLAAEGGWDDLDLKKKAGGKLGTSTASKGKGKRKSTADAASDDADCGVDEEIPVVPPPAAKAKSTRKTLKEGAADTGAPKATSSQTPKSTTEGVRRSKRLKSNP